MSLRGRVLPISLVVLLPTLAGVTTAVAMEEWVSVGPHGANVRALAEDPATANRVYAATRYGGVYVSDDGGRSWVRRSQGLPSTAARTYEGVYGITVDPVDGTVYSMGASDVYVSNNGGSTWSRFLRPDGAVGKFSRLYIDPDDHNKLTLLNLKGVFVYDYVGTDVERSWTLTPGLSPIPVFGLERAPSNPDIFYAVTGHQAKLYRSDDRVGSWTEVGPLPGTEFRDLAVDSSDPSRLYLSVDSGCYLSVDGGLSWTQMDDPGDDAQIFQFAVFDHSVLAVGRGGLFDNSSNQDQLEKLADFYHTRTFEALVRSDGSYLLASEMGVFEGPSAGSGTLAHRNNGMNNADVTAIGTARGSRVIYAATGIGYDAGVFRSDDEGNTWELRSMGLTNPDIRSIAVFNDDIVYVGSTDANADTGENGSIFRTIDGGLTWTDVGGSLPHARPRIIKALVVHPTDPDILYASVQAHFGGIFKTTDGGETWARRSVGLESMPPMPGFEGEENPFINYFAMLSLDIHPSDPEVIYIGAGGCWGGTYRTRNGAESWDRRSSGSRSTSCFTTSISIPQTPIIST
jgi:photosystem II stability/assembly factor-like uncharacterized protein